jgi:hypothetical protein
VTDLQHSLVQNRNVLAIGVQADARDAEEPEPLHFNTAMYGHVLILNVFLY